MTGVREMTDSSWRSHGFDARDATEWLRSRHPWLDDIIREVTPEDPWLPAVSIAVREGIENDSAWVTYARWFPVPPDPAEQAAWRDQGPRLTDAADRFLRLAPADRGALRLLTTLDPAGAPLGFSGLRLDARGTALLDDWWRVLRTRIDIEEPPAR